MVRPRALVFSLNLSSPVYLDFIRTISNIKPAQPLPPIRWRLDRVLPFALLHRFQDPSSLRDRTLILLFLLDLATGTRGSELHAVLTGDDHVIFFRGWGIPIPQSQLFSQKRGSPT